MRHEYARVLFSRPGRGSEIRRPPIPHPEHELAQVEKEQASVYYGRFMPLHRITPRKQQKNRKLVSRSEVAACLVAPGGRFPTELE
jgi:hypothetical protein